VEKLKRPKLTRGLTERVNTGCGYVYITPNRDSRGNLIEVFVKLGKAGSCSVAFLEAITRAVSLGLKYGIPVEEYIEELKGIKCPSSSWEDGSQILSCADAVAKVLENESRSNQSSKVPK